MSAVSSSFSAFALLPSLLTTLNGLALVQPTEIQGRTIPALLGGRSVVGVAETGSGKTLAYVLPLLHQLKSLEAGGEAVTAESTPRGVVLVPTRELGEQVARVFKQFTHDTRLRVRMVLGGGKQEIARRNVAGAFEIVVATPGRLRKLVDAQTLSLADVRTLVLDEADQLVDLGFLPDARAIAEACPPGRQLALFSATVPPAVEALIRDVFADPSVISTRGSHKVVPTLKTKNLAVSNANRLKTLLAVLAEPTEGATLVFANTREQCDKIIEAVTQAGHGVVAVRGEMDAATRKANLAAFRDGKVDILVGTDLASRGLDVARITRVVNVWLPYGRAAYLHRAGRTARAGREGLVVNLTTERDAALFRGLARDAE